MFTTRSIRRFYGENICRRCINQAYQVRLEGKDCIYGESGKCCRCKQYRHIVTGFRPSGMLKTLGAKNREK